MQLQQLLATASSALLLTQPQIPISLYLTHAEAAALVLLEWYNNGTGLWDTTSWWNSANCITVLADLVSLNPVLLNQTNVIFETTFSQAQKQAPGFVNDYYDDNGWWALAWTTVYDVTGNVTYLHMAASIFEAMSSKEAWSAKCGGLWWRKVPKYPGVVGAIENELFLAVAASLADRVPPNGQHQAVVTSDSYSPSDCDLKSRSYYLNWALKEWTWFKNNSTLINPQHTINNDIDLDGTVPTCRNKNNEIWTYNQGVILSGLVELSHAVSSREPPNRPHDYLSQAHSIAHAAITTLQDPRNGILRELCEPDKCDADQTQFKGCFMRGLRTLHEVSPKKEYAAFMLANADSIWAHGRNKQGQIGLVWSGSGSGSSPEDVQADASTHSSGLHALVAAAAVVVHAGQPG